MKLFKLVTGYRYALWEDLFRRLTKDAAKTGILDCVEFSNEVVQLAAKDPRQRRVALNGTINVTILYIGDMISFITIFK
jgi:hypothetical protein